MSSDLTDKLFLSIDTIVSSRIESLPYDKTIECYITNIDRAADGIYKVKYQNAEFEAVSDNTTFQLNEEVYVHVPQADFDKDKIIIRKKQLDDIQKVKKLPFLSMAKSLNFFTIALNEEIFLLEITNKESTGNTSFIWNDLVYAGYTKLGIKASMMLDLSDTILSGDYGLKIDIISFDQSKAIDNTNKLTETYYLLMKDMVGANFYKTNGYQNQEKVIDITNKVISSIKISFWQDGKFTSKEYGAIRNKFIHYTNLLLYLGYDIAEFKTNPLLFLYTENGLQYSMNINSKILKARLLTLDTNTLFFTENNNEFARDTNLKMYWGKYNPNGTVVSPIYLLMAYETINVNLLFKQAVELSTIRNRIQELYVCAIGNEIGTAQYISNILTFPNVTYLANSAILDIITGLLANVAEDNGIYLFYGLDNIATNKIATSTPHYLVVNYISANEEGNNNGLNEGDVIIWKIPKYRTMIIAPRAGIEYRESINGIEGCDTTDDNYWIITQTILASDLDTAGAYRIPFYISDYYSPQKTNNTIICLLLRKFDIYETSKELLFGTSGSLGNEYNVRVRLWQYDENYENKKKYVNAYYLSSGLNTPYFLETEAYDYDNNPILIKQVHYKLLYNSTISPQFSFLINSNSLINVLLNSVTGEVLNYNDIAVLLNNYYNSTSGAYTTNTEGTSLHDTTYICLKRINSSNILLDYFSNVIEASVEINGKEYKSYLPLAIAKDENYIAISGSTVLTYDITGKKPFYTKTPFKLETLYKEISTTKDYRWHIYTPEDINSLEWIPKLFPEEEEGKKELVPPTIFKQDSNNKFALICSIEEKRNSTWNKDNVVWILPIHIILNKYPGAMENAEVNYAYINSNEYVIHTMVGRITEDTAPGTIGKTMSGLFMGVLGKRDITGIETLKLGLYAYKLGRQFFCVDEDGTLFLDGGLDLDSRIANITLSKCKLENNFFDFTENSARAGENDVDVIVIKDYNNNTVVNINSSGEITGTKFNMNTLSFAGQNKITMAGSRIVNRVPNATTDTAFLYGTAAFVDNLNEDSTLLKDLRKIKQALKQLGKNIDTEWIT